MKLIDRIGWWGEDLLLGVHLQAQSEEINIVLCKKAKGGIRIQEQHSFTEIKACLGFLAKAPGIPIVAFISPKVVVEGFVPAGNNDPLQHLMGVSIDNRTNFVQQAFGSFHSVARKEDIQTLLALFGSFAERIIQLYYSPAVASFLLPAMDEYQAESSYQLRVHNQAYTWQGGLVDGLEKSNELDESDLAYRLGLSEKSLLPYAALVYHHLSQEVAIQGLPIIEVQRKTQKQYSLWTKTLGLIWLFLLISGGFLLAWNRYADWQIQENEQVVAANRAMLNRIADKDQQIAKQYAFVEGAAKSRLKSTQVTHYLDQLLGLVPEDMYLRNWILAPHEEALKKIDLGLIAEAPDILVQGEARNAQALSAVPQDWEKLSYVARTRMWEAQYDYENQMQVFTLLIWLEDE